MIRCAAAALALLGLLGLAGPASAAPRFAPCPAEGRSARCADVRVPLDASGALPGTVALRTLRIRARHPHPGPRRAAIHLSGGPGGGGLEEARYGLADLAPLARSHDLVAFDQRGTGASGLLRCRALERDGRLRSTSAAAACAAALGPRRALYTTQASVVDLEAVRVAVGADRVVLYGVSYGTKLALAYARAHPERVERLILDSVVDPDDTDPFALDAYRAIAPSLRALCPADCHGISDDPEPTWPGSSRGCGPARWPARCGAPTDRGGGGP
jgi:pimeloyl-ACP methyl ester carboxylesterase